jgi:hypothetical protein
MQRFDQKGMMIFPAPEKIKKAGKMADLVVIEKCYCPNGHDLVSDQAVFDGFNGIILKVKKAGKEGQVALNPVYGLKHRVSIGIKLEKDDLLEVLCPVCGVPLPVYSACSCGGSLISLFMDEKPDFTNSVLICNRVDCHNAQIRLHNEIASYDDLGHVVFK